MTVPPKPLHFLALPQNYHNTTAILSFQVSASWPMLFPHLHMIPKYLKNSCPCLKTQCWRKPSLVREETADQMNTPAPHTNHTSIPQYWAFTEHQKLPLGSSCPGQIPEFAVITVDMNCVHTFLISSPRCPKAWGPLAVITECPSFRAHTWEPCK